MQAPGRVAPRGKRTQSPPQKKIVARNTTPPVTTRQQTRSAQPVATSQEAAMARAEMQYQMKMREKPSQEKRDPKRKRVIMPEASEEEAEEEEEREKDEKHSSTNSGFDDYVDDPAYKMDPREQNDRELEGPLPDCKTWLESRYVKWLHDEVVKARSSYCKQEWFLGMGLEAVGKEGKIFEKARQEVDAESYSHCMAIADATSVSRPTIAASVFGGSLCSRPTHIVLRLSNNSSNDDNRKLQGRRSAWERVIAEWGFNLWIGERGFEIQRD
ncbi:hypothetical protein RHMOL_Rhmol02G0196200 [Rhododendron molle]|uniref:Uncharacterized protein n=1 Tax=Rhododendron molle TaxID=49168 RepID=A0ACC0PTB6_RHOML|nr:hypothetical protein RHMOL_Rhmol02G0196200 [Rhododendron molle]